MFLLLSLLGLAAADCVVDKVDADVRQEEDGWARTDTWQIHVETGLPMCRRFHLRTAPGMEFKQIKAVVRQWDDTRTRLGPERLVSKPAGVAAQTHILELPELRTRDRLKLVVTRTGKVPGQLEFSEEWWTDPGPGHVSEPKQEPGEIVSTHHRISLAFPPDKERRFGAGGTASAEHSVSREHRVKGKQEESWTVTGASAAGIHTMVGNYILEVEGEGLTLAGAGPGLDASVSGKLRFELKEGSQVASWRVVRDGQRPVLPSRADVISQVASEALSMSIPQPGLGLMFKGRDADWVVVGEVLSELRRQVVEGALTGVHPLKPRRLQRARRSRWATPWEQALLLTRYLRQLKIDALPVPVRPRADGEIEGAVPQGYSAAVVRVRLDGLERWIDPACGVCAVGEIRSGLWGGQTLSSGLSRLPDRPDKPSWAVTSAVKGDHTTFTARFGAPWSLSLRNYLVRFPVPKRDGAILGWLGAGTGAVIAHDGIGDLGGTIMLQIRVPTATADKVATALEARRASP